MRKWKLLRGMVASRLLSRRTIRKLASAAANSLRPTIDMLECRTLFSGAAGADDVLQGPVTSAATAAWYTQRVAILQSLHLTGAAKPFDQISRSGPAKPLQMSSPDPAGLTPTQLKTYYNFSGLRFGSTPGDGRGQTIALVDAYNDPDITGDLKTFDKAYGLPAPPSFKVVSQTGSSTSLPPADKPDPVNGSWASEESLDVEWAHALAPGAKILLVECNSPFDADLYTGAAYAASAPGVSEVSMSFGLSEVFYTPAQLAAIDPTFTTPAGHTGVTFLASSGDDGSFSDGGPLATSYPSSSPNVISVGGTTLSTDSNGDPVGETAWSGSGGGVSVLETQADAQRVAVGSYPGRADPDVSFDADPNSGVNICDSFDFSAATPFAVFGGTSFSSPAWAAIFAITNQGRVAAGRPELDGQFQTIPDLYSDYTNGSYSSVFKDIIGGNTGFYSATKGYDLTTGLGSPNVKALVLNLVANTVQSTPPTIGSFVVLPPKESPGASVTLTASDVTDTAGDVTGVNFYSVNGTASTLLGAGTVDASGHWTLSISTAGLVAGNTYAYGAVAINNFKQDSPRVTADNTVVAGEAPTIANFSVSPTSEPFGTAVLLTATGVTDAASKIASVAFYLQSGASLTLLGNGTEQSAGRWDLTASTLRLAPGLYTYVAIATAASGLVSTPATATNTVTLGGPITIVVNTTKDQTDTVGSKTVSLRDAVAIADAGGAAVTIDFDPTVFAKFHTIVLTGKTLSLTNANGITIQGPTAGVAISGDGATEVFSIGTGSVVQMSGLTITDGLSTGAGGGLINAGDATLTDVTVSNSTASGPYSIGNGGGIENDGTLSLVDSIITGNFTQDGSGGGLYNTGKLTASGTVIANNSANGGGGLGNSDIANLSECTISGNTAEFDGGGVLNYGTASVSASTISGNSADTGGGVYNSVAYLGTNGAVATLTNSTVSGNHAQNDSAILNGAKCDLITTDSTISQNYGLFYGSVYNSGLALIANTIIAGNTASSLSSDGPDVTGSFTSQGHNLIGETDGSTGWTGTDFRGTTAKPVAADLTPLGDFGGPTQTMVPYTGSPALGNGSTSLIPAGITTDQRGKARVVNGQVDIGSVEVQSEPAVKIVAPATQTSVAGRTTLFKLGSFTDPNTKGPFTMIVNWGDGSAGDVDYLNSAGTIPEQSHLFLHPGTFTGSVVIIDDLGNSSDVGKFAIKISAAEPVTITVNTINDQFDSPGSKTVSLADAVAMADTLAGKVTIQFDPKVFAAHQTITLSEGSLLLDMPAGQIDINGPAAGVSVSGNGMYGVMQIDSGFTASLSNLAIVDGSSDVLVGGVFNMGTLNVVDCTFSGDNGAIENFGTLTLINTTLADNSAQDTFGGGLDNLGNASLINVTITGNSATAGGGIYSYDDSSLTLANTIVAGNTVIGTGAVGPEIEGTVSSEGHNLIGNTDGSGGWVSSDLVGTIAKPLNADLTVLGNYGGPTQTVLPETGSPAIGAGSVRLIPPGITTDQRGQPRTIGGKVDIGAVEV
jgi:hypothetical protein